jgi:hypothetical protein
MIFLLLPTLHGIGVYRDDPKLKDLVYELKEVNWNQLGIQLNVPRHILRNIDQEYPSNESRKLSEVLQYWIDDEPAASWEKILQALQRIGGHKNIITSIQSKYCTISPQPQGRIESLQRIGIHDEIIPTIQSKYIPPSISQPTSCIAVQSESLSQAEEDVRYMIDRTLSVVDQLLAFPAELRIRPCTDTDLVHLSHYIGGWKELSSFLHLSPRDTADVHEAKQMLREWSGKFGERANYR